MSKKNKRDYDAEATKVMAFSRDFKALVRKYIPTSCDKHSESETDVLAQMQDRTSVYSAFIWDD